MHTTVVYTDHIKHIMYSSSAPSNFTLTLPSDASRAKHPDNKPNLFTVELDGGVSLPGGGEAWEAALLEVEYPHMWDTVDSDCRILFMLVDTKRLPVGSNSYTFPNPEFLEANLAARFGPDLNSITVHQAFDAVSRSLQEADKPIKWQVFARGMVTENLESKQYLSAGRVTQSIVGNFADSSQSILQMYPSFFVDIPKGYYQNPSEICILIQNCIKQKIAYIMEKIQEINGVRSMDSRLPTTEFSRQEWIPTLHTKRPNIDVTFNTNSQKVEFQYNHNYTGFMFARSPYLFQLLGFQYHTVKSKIPRSDASTDIIGEDYFIAAAIKSERAVVELDTHDTIYLYSDICEYQRLGEQKVPLLGVFPVSGEHGTQNAFFFNPPTYLPVKTSHLDRITIQMGTDQNKLVDFTGGKVVVRLNIRKKREGI